ncbi:hypothetical protein LLH06_05405 [Mucilaginibacter daejeonensis]|uniref:hypothetical protein n=1 Tax=Mucilaginibacter daejeonensis TaxID=398049 RepID=UPI001D174C0F|nr:hypothetical protein [Mucilaginibacter daejeonensis]UEG54401.1 hypothetical protein LLH06_05405 [Mucilaginibacter daejeonensis]
MKLSKATLIRLTRSGLERLGYKAIKDTITPAEGLYLKVINNDYYISLGLTISRNYDHLFTGAYYLSRNTTWATIGADVPKMSYQRIGNFLTEEERQMLLGGEYAQQKNGDAWWCSNSEANLLEFFEAVRLTENRFLRQPNLIEQINSSNFINELSDMAKKTILSVEVVAKNSNEAYQFSPSRPIDGIPIAWFNAAEKVIRERNAVLNVDTVKRLAADAYRQHILNS